jgi:predicted membrane protein|tara:strand:- start:2436 stop:2642 length:207 start_codon:yes stop_codon:yes gene_type:complete
MLIFYKGCEMDILLILATVLAISLTAAGAWAITQEKRQWQKITEQAERSGIRSTWIDELDKRLMSDAR